MEKTRYTSICFSCASGLYVSPKYLGISFFCVPILSVPATHCVLEVGSRMKSVLFSISPSHEHLGFGDLFVIM